MRIFLITILFVVTATARWVKDLCPAGDAAPIFPANQTVLGLPTNKTLNFVTVGRGVQDYTCSRRTFVSNGTRANLYDVGCFLTGQSLFPTSKLAASLPALALENIRFPQIGAIPQLALEHQFVPNPAGGAGTFPEFLDPGTGFFVVLAVNASFSAPQSATAVPWLELAAIDGDFDFGTTAFRTDTVGGVAPPSRCQRGQTVSVPYAALYWFYI